MYGLLANTVRDSTVLAQLAKGLVDLVSGTRIMISIHDFEKGLLSILSPDCVYT